MACLCPLLFISKYLQGPGGTGTRHLTQTTRFVWSAIGRLCAILGSPGSRFIDTPPNSTNRNHTYSYLSGNGRVNGSPDAEFQCHQYIVGRSVEMRI